MVDCDRWCTIGINAGTFVVCCIFSNLDVKVEGMISKFVDDMKNDGVQAGKEFCLRVQQDIGDKFR